jgi:hypothetical protein
MKRGELRQFLWSAPPTVRGQIFLVIDARQTLADFLMDGNLYKNWDINFVELNSKVIDETG